MNAHRTQHTTFVIERQYDYSPQLVFSAWSTREGNASWFAGTSEWQEQLREFDFCVGGRERLRGVWSNSTTSFFDSQYHDIVANQRIVYTYDMYVDDQQISVSLSTAEFLPVKSFCLLKYTEQAVFLSYDDNGSRERGTQMFLINLAALCSISTFRSSNDETTSH